MSKDERCLQQYEPDDTKNKKIILEKDGLIFSDGKGGYCAVEFTFSDEVNLRPVRFWLIKFISSY